MANLPNAFYDDAAVAFRGSEVPAASFTTGMNSCASNGPGIGIATDNTFLGESLWPATDGSGDLDTGSWTLLDQHGNARDAQIGQVLGGPGFVDRSSTDWPSSGGQEGTLPDGTIRLFNNPANVNGVPDNDAAPVADNSAVLLDLDVGWTSAIPTP